VTDLSAPPTSESGRRLARALENGDPEEVQIALVASVFEEPDDDWMYEQCLAAAQMGPWQVTAVAATCIGHLARLRGYIRDEMLPFLESLPARDPRIRSYAEDAIEDVRFAISRREGRSENAP
jgi:hypothetical protein